MIDKYETIFIDSITVAGRLCFQWCRGQPEATSEKTGKPDIRGAYGLHGREMIGWLTHLQHTRGKNVSGSSGSSTRGSTTSIARSSSRRSTARRPGSSCRGSSTRSSPWPTIPDAGGQPQRAFVCQTLNPWGFPAKDRSGRLDMVEAPASRPADGEDPRSRCARADAPDPPPLTPRRSPRRRGTPGHSIPLTERSPHHVRTLERFNSAQSNANVIPKGTLAKVRLTLRPGGFDDPSAGLDRRLRDARHHRRRLPRRRIHRARGALCAAQDLGR